MKFVISLICLWSAIGLAQEFSNPEIDPRAHMNKNGQLFDVRVVPKDKQTMFYIVGKRAARLKWDKLQVEATLFPGNNQPARKLSLKPGKDAFIHEGSLEPGEISVDVKGEKPEDKENFRFQMKP